jgi:hypothetical protein
MSQVVDSYSGRKEVDKACSIQLEDSMAVDTSNKLEEVAPAGIC